MSCDLQARYVALHREMVAQFERTAAVENHWLMYTLLGWENLTACGLSHYLLTGPIGQTARWPYVVMWLVQIVIAIATIKLVTGRQRIEESPLEPINKRVWVMFLFLCINVAVLNVIAGYEVFVFLPVLAVLSSFGFTVMTAVMSPRFMAAGLGMFATGIVMARFPEHGFLIYGAGWLVILQTMGIIFLRKRERWLAETPLAALHDPLTPNPAPSGQAETVVSG